MELGPNCFRLRGSLRIEDGTPCRYREDKDVVGRRLGRESGGHADSLKQRVDVRDRRDAGHPHGRRRKTGPIDADLVADPRMQVRGRLAVQNRSIEAAAQERDLVGKGCEIIGRNADRLAGAGHLLRIAGCGGEAVDPGVLDRSDQLCGAGLVQRRLDRCPVDPRAQLDLPVDRHVGDGASRHGVGRRNDEDRERCGERHGERNSGGSRKSSSGRDPEQAPEPVERDHAAEPLFRADQASVLHPPERFDPLRDSGIVGRHDKSGRVPTHMVENHGKRGLTRGLVELAGGLVSQQQGRTMDERPRNPDALRLAA